MPPALFQTMSSGRRVISLNARGAALGSVKDVQANGFRSDALTLKTGDDKVAQISHHGS
ncbi:MAG: hypothetical protein JWO45_2 [Spartobacteria bacterium]|nr:hypothetical protein [Spartobacteria bacterium]